MISLISQVDFNIAIINPLTSIAVVIGFIVVIWRIAVNYQKQENAHTNLENRLVYLEKAINKVISDAQLGDKELEKFFADALNKDKLEWKEEVKQALSDTTGRFQDIQAQLTNIKSQLKDVDNRVTIVDTIVKGHTEGIKALHVRIKGNVKFFTKWIQRVEDRVEKSQDRAVQMVRDSIREVMGQMSMLINMRRPTR